VALDIFPQGLLWPDSIRWYPARVTDSGGISEGGLERLAVTDGGGKWMCEITVPLLEVSTIKLARAFISRCRGGATPVLVPFFNDAEGPYPGGTPPGTVPFSDGSTFSDRSEFSSGSITITAGAAALRATTLAITIGVSGDLIGGEAFSINHPTRGEHLYLIDGVNDDGAIDIWPPLREAISADTPLNFDTPRCKMMLLNSGDAMAAIKPPYLSSLTLQFREAF
jgi:hypothetical protein